MMLCPEDARDPRATFPGLKWLHTRAYFEILSEIRAQLRRAGPPSMPGVPAPRHTSSHAAISRGCPGSSTKVTSRFSDGPGSRTALGPPAPELSAAMARGMAWVCCRSDELAVGYARASIHGAAAHLDELDVLPEFGRLGLGSMLVQFVCDWAMNRGLGSVVLTTFLDVPWNGPFYASLGFQPVPEHEWTPGMREIKRVEELEMGLPWNRRGFLKKTLAGFGAAA